MASEQVNLTAADFYEEENYTDEIPDIQRVTKKNNVLPQWGNSAMNLNGLVLENVKESYYYKNHLIEIDEYHKLIDEIYYKVKHLEPWEKGTRKVQGMTGMCGGVRGVGAGGVVSSAFCLLYRLFNIRITRKQLISMINNTQSPYIRGLGFMYIRFCQPPSDLWNWLEPYLDDEDEVDPRSGGGEPMQFGTIVRLMLTKLDWYGTLFPRIPVPIQKEIDEKFKQRKEAILMKEAMIRGERADRHRSSSLTDRELDRKRAAPRDEREREREEKRPKVTRCSHHLRHHHCRKHRQKCPEKSKENRRKQDEENERLAKEKKDADEKMEICSTEKDNDNTVAQKTTENGSGSTVDGNGNGTSL